MSPNQASSPTAKFVPLPLLVEYTCPAHTLPATPIPPVTINAPVPVDVLPVALLIVNALVIVPPLNDPPPVLYAIPFAQNTPFVVVMLPTVATPGIVRLPVSVNVNRLVVYALLIISIPPVLFNLKYLLGLVVRLFVDFKDKKSK